MTNSIRPGQDTFDSRDVIERIAELEAVEVIDREPEEQDELDELYAFAEEAESTPDWVHGEQFIADDYFEDYAKQLAEDIGAIDREAEWPLGYIDWEAAAAALQVDYTDYQFGGVTYWARG